MDQRWQDVDAYIQSSVLGEDSEGERVLGAQQSAELPDIAVSRPQGRLLSVLARSIGAERVVEFGTLGGYSTLCLARALPPHGRVVTFELDERHASVARASLDAAGVGHQVTIRVGPALERIETLAHDEPFDLAFIDADKPSNVHYYEAAMTRMRPGGLVIVDNVVRDGEVADPNSADERVQGSRAVIDRVGADPRVEATVIQTVGSKGYDGMLIATVLD
ncbi:O-methyltransferase [Demequina activiva]|uniref:O-methyltransferase n=1 Tax=Demequina activiva TaxID=1582364 RepID=A0A919UGI8_9MICO|nr:O-methyltransferase [Demequina activiva]GIG54882.1 O-methyltransferase [Demequina activiva]